MVIGAMVAAGEVDLPVAIVLTVVINLVIWLVSPWLTDLTLRWFNKRSSGSTMPSSGGVILACIAS